MDLIPNFAMETWVLVATSLVLLYILGPIHINFLRSWEFLGQPLCLFWELFCSTLGVFGILTENVMKNTEKCGGCMRGNSPCWSSWIPT
nr:nonfunctional cytochrome P450 CYP3A43.2 [Homo sapiens]AAQ92354.1 nonfunctional cytochrome P450 CYP3A43.2 [Homo sapiens]